MVPTARAATPVSEKTTQTLLPDLISNKGWSFGLYKDKGCLESLHCMSLPISFTE